MDAVSVGDETNIQDLTVVHVDTDAPCVIGNRVTIGHRAVVHGCVLEDECLIGMGAVIQNRARVGRHALVGAGSVVREGFEIPPGVLALGVPATIKRELTETEVAAIVRSAAGYAARAKLYRQSLTQG